MEPGTVNDLEAQEALARDFRPDLQVGLSRGSHLSLVVPASDLQRPCVNLSERWWFTRRQSGEADRA